MTKQESITESHKQLSGMSIKQWSQRNITSERKQPDLNVFYRRQNFILDH